MKLSFRQTIPKQFNMKKILKKEILHTIENAMTQALSNLQISTPTKKTKKVIDKVSKKLTNEVKRELKKQTKKAAKSIAPANKKTKKAKTVGKELVAA
jgi:hypothetical protein